MYSILKARILKTPPLPNAEGYTSSHSKSNGLSFLLLLGVLLCLCLGGCQNKEASPDADSFTENSSPSGHTIQNSQAASSDFSALCLELFTEWVQGDGLTLHYTLDQPEAYGISLTELSLGSASPAAVQGTADILTSAKEQLGRIDFDSLTLEEQMHYRIIMDYIDRELAQTAFPLYEEPLNASAGIQAQLPILLSEYAFSEISDVTSYFSLLNSVDEYFASLLQFEMTKKEAGLLMQPESIKRIIAQCESFTANEENNFLITTFDSRLQSLPGILMPWDKSKLQEENKRLVLEVVLPAYEFLISGLKNLLTDVQTDPSAPSGLCRLPKGQEWYEHLVREATGSSQNTESLFQRTQSEINAAMSALSSLCQAHPALTENLAGHQFSLQSPEDILDDLKAKIGLYFPDISDSHCSIRYVADSLKEYVSPAFYLTSPIDTCRHTIYINENESFNPGQLYPTLAHEAFPGHLYQDTYFNDHNTCELRTLLYYPGYTEGWAVYSELLSYGYEENFSRELISALQKSQEITLGLYALMDMGIHYHGWEQQQVAGILRSCFGIEDQDTVEQIYQLILEDPANYLSYYVGYQELCYIQKECQSRLGDAYDPLQFHQAVLTIGPASYPLIGEYVPLLITEHSDAAD